MPKLLLSDKIQIQDCQRSTKGKERECEKIKLKNNKIQNTMDRKSCEKIYLQCQLSSNLNYGKANYKGKNPRKYAKLPYSSTLSKNQSFNSNNVLKFSHRKTESPGTYPVPKQRILSMRQAIQKIRKSRKSLL